ncbi:MAG: ABC transporter substrate-binding protein [Gallionellaceae bacterium]|nr:ABC transporter substrate-binding protein [Gallionellaceae bacterium]
MKRGLNRGRVSLQLAALLAAVLAGFIWFFAGGHNRKPDIKIGVLHSLSGEMSSAEAPLVDAIRLAVEESNESGALGSQKIEMVVADCRSDADYCAQQAEKLITRDHVNALFGCWTSSCRRAVKAVVEKHRHLLFYPLRYEGLEQSPDIIYTGAAPNQQIIPMAKWALQNKGRRIYMVGTNQIYTRLANLMVRDLVNARGGELLGERYLPPGASGMATVVKEIAALRPDFVLSTLDGASNLHFYHALREAGIDAEKTPVFSASIAENDLVMMGPELVVGHYAAWSYFQSLENEANKIFVERFKQRFGSSRVINDPMEASYIGVKLFVDSVRGQNPVNLGQAKSMLALQTMQAPEGIVAVDPASRHLWKAAHIGRARADGQFDIVWKSPQAIQPSPFPFYRTREEWLAVRKALPGGW